MKRRAFIKSGLLFVPAVITARKSIAQSFGFSDVAFMAQQKAAAGGGGGTCTDPSIVTGHTLGTTRTDSFWAGFYTFTNKSVIITCVGRWVISGNNQTHTVEIVTGTPGTGPWTVQGSASVNTSGATAGQFLYATLSSPITVGNGVYLYILSDETAGIDAWYSDDSTITQSADFTPQNSCYSTANTTFLAHNAAPAAYGLVDFKYH